MANRALTGARKKGYEARMAGKLKVQCPYPETRGGKYGNVPTWSRAFQNAWYTGWDKADLELRRGY